MAALLCAWCWETQAYAVRCCRGVVLAAPFWMVRGGGCCSCQHTPGVASPTIDACRAKMRGRKPEPELEYDVQPHPCDRIGLQLSRCGDHVNQPYVCFSAPPIMPAPASVGPSVLSHTPGGTNNNASASRRPSARCSSAWTRTGVTRSDRRCWKASMHALMVTW